jgi:hypothetical protein
MRRRQAVALVTVLAAAAAALRAPAVRADPDPGFAFGNVGRPVFEHLYADLSDPHFGMRVYFDEPVPGTLHSIPDPSGPGANARAAAPNGDHFFWDATLGERAPVIGWYDSRTCPPMFSCGAVLSFVAAAYVLVDLSSQSSGVLDTDYRLGASLDIRPWRPGLDHLSFSLGYYHQSSHLGDEYVLSAPTIQSTTSAPEVNPFLPYRANPSVEAFPLVVSADITELSPLRLRAYGGPTLLASTQLPLGTPFRVGAELRWDRPFDHSLPVQVEGGLPRRRAARWRRDLSFMLAYDLLVQHQYVHLGPEPGPPLFAQVSADWFTSHGMLTAFYNLDPERSTTNALGLSGEILWGRVQHGQFPEYATVKTVAASLSYYW